MEGLAHREAACEKEVGCASGIGALLARQRARSRKAASCRRGSFCAVVIKSRRVVELVESVHGVLLLAPGRGIPPSQAFVEFIQFFLDFSISLAPSLTGVPWVSLPGPTGVMTHPGRMMSHQSANPVLLLCTELRLDYTDCTLDVPTCNITKLGQCCLLIVRRRKIKPN